MKIDLSEILSVKDKEKTLKYPLDMERFVTSVYDAKITDKSDVIIELKNTGKKKFKLKLETSFGLILPCDRCLSDVSIDMHIKVNRNLDLSVEPEDKDEFCYIDDDGKLDVEKLVHNEILINMPTKILCKEDCKGICNRCGTNLNLQSCDCKDTETVQQMSTLGDILNKLKEV